MKTALVVVFMFSALSLIPLARGLDDLKKEIKELRFTELKDIKESRAREEVIGHLLNLHEYQIDVLTQRFLQ